MPLVMGATIVLYVLAMLLSRGDMQMVSLSPSNQILFLLGGSGAAPVFQVRALVDAADRGLAARRRPPHLLQRALDSTARAGGR